MLPVASSRAWPKLVQMREQPSFVPDNKNFQFYIHMKRGNKSSNTYLSGGFIDIVSLDYMVGSINRRWRRRYVVSDGG